MFFFEMTDAMLVAEKSMATVDLTLYRRWLLAFTAYRNSLHFTLRFTDSIGPYGSGFRHSWYQPGCTICPQRCS